MQIGSLNSSPIGGVGLCSKDINQPETSMQIGNRRPVYLTEIHGFRPESLRSSHQSFSIQKHSMYQHSQYSKNSHQSPKAMNLPNDANQTYSDFISILPQIDHQT